MAARRWRSSPSTSRLSITSPRACRPSSDCRSAKNSLVIPAKRAARARAGTHNHRQIAWARWSDIRCNCRHRWLWVPAFAGTTTGNLPACPDVQHVAVFGAEIVDPAQPRIGIGALAFAIDRNQRGLDVGLHLSAVAADVNDRAAFDQAPNPFLLRGDQILHVGLQLVRVEKILIRMPAAEKQHRRAELRAFCLQRGALLQEATERRQTGA